MDLNSLENNKEKPDRGADDARLIDEVTTGDYKYGFTTDIDTDILPHGLDEDTVRFISRTKGEPE